MSAGPEALDRNALEQERRKLNLRLEEVSRLCESEMPPSVFYGELLRRLLESLAAPLGAVWLKTAQGNLQLQFQINLRDAGFDKTDESRAMHEELLRYALTQTPPKPFHLTPKTGLGSTDPGKTAPGNPTDFTLLVVPIVVNGMTVGIIEVGQGSNRAANAIPGFLQYATLMSDLAARFQRNQNMATMAGQQQLWSQLEVFSRQIHGTLTPIDVAYVVANEGRRLVACDRVSVVLRQHGDIAVEAISGADVVEKRSNLVQLMKALAKEVLNWGEKLVFNGIQDDTLPPKVSAALDNYLAESGSKLLVIQPLKDEREEKSKLPIRSAIIMECFDPPTDAQQLVARLEIVGRHCTSALYNAIEHRRIPMRWVWIPIVKFQEGLGGQKKAIFAAISAAVVLLVSVMILVPYPLKMEATGQLQPEVRRKIFPATEGIIREIRVSPGSIIPENTNLGIMHDGQLEREIRGFRKEIQLASADVIMFEHRATKGSESDKLQSHTEAEKTRIVRDAKERELQALLARTNGDPVPQREGFFYLRSPFFTSTEASLLGDKRSWTILSTNFKEDLTERAVKPTDELLRLGAKDGPWEIETKIPQQNIGHILMAYHDLNSDVLDVEFILRADSSRKFHGKLRRDRIGGEAMPAGNDQENPDPMVTAFVTITKEDLVKLRVDNLLVSGTEIRAKVRCGNKPMGYALFYGVWEFFYEKVIFFF